MTKTNRNRRVFRRLHNYLLKINLSNLYPKYEAVKHSKEGTAEHEEKMRLVLKIVDYEGQLCSSKTKKQKHHEKN